MRHDFSPQTKELLAKRSGFMCSFPGCGKCTIGPNYDNTEDIASVGMACHIYCASQGPRAKRRHPNPSPEFLSSISNGIWMCYTHGKLIDTDDGRFSVIQLTEWRQTNEAAAALVRDSGVDYQTAYKLSRNGTLIANEVQLPPEAAINKQVGDALSDSCLSIAWGKDLSDAIRDYIVEHVRNAHSHGSATKSNLIVTSRELKVIDDGSAFHPRSLNVIASGQGGASALKHLLDEHGEQICFLSITENGENTLTISVPSSAEKIRDLTPCSVSISIYELHDGDFHYQVQESCQEVVIILPEYFALSDIAFLSRKHPQIKNETRHVVFVLSHASDLVTRLLQEQFPKAQLLVLNSR